MKRYLLFVSPVYYPLGGMSDFILDFDILAQAKNHTQAGVNNDFDTFVDDGRGRRASIYDTVERKEVTRAYLGNQGEIINWRTYDKEKEEWVI